MIKSFDHNHPILHKSGSNVNRGAASEPRRKILAAAYQLFCEKGLGGARTREIARRADVNIAMLHYYFGSKKALYFQVIQPLLMDIFDRLQKAAAISDDPLERLEALTDVYFDFLQEHPDFPRLIMWELANGARILQNVLPELLNREKSGLPASVVRIFKDGQKRGFFRRHIPEHAFISLVALCVFPFIANKFIEVVFPDVIGRSDFISVRRQHVLELLLKGLSA